MAQLRKYRNGQFEKVTYRRRPTGNRRWRKLGSLHWGDIFTFKGSTKEYVVVAKTNYAVKYREDDYFANKTYSSGKLELRVKYQGNVQI